MTSDDVKARAAAVGFDLCGIAPVDAHPELEFLRHWIAMPGATTTTS
jgi:epoxyqueuosine reductase QueG